MRIQYWFWLTRAVQLNIFGNTTKTDSSVSTVAWKDQEKFSPRDLAQFDRNNAFINLFFPITVLTHNNPSQYYKK